MSLRISQRSAPRQGQLARTLELSGSLAPVDELAFAVEHRGEVEWLKGSSVAVVHLDGPEQVPTDMSFSWRGNAFVQGEALLDGRPILDLVELVDLVSSMVADSVLVDVTWRGRTMVGYMRAFEPREGKAFSYEASLTFAWTQVPGLRALGTKAGPSPASLGAQMDQLFEGALSGSEALVTFARGVVDDAAQAVAMTRQNIQRVTDIAMEFRNVAHSSIGLLRSVAASIQQVFIATADLEEAFAVSADELAQTEDAWSQIKARQYRAHQLRGARLARHQAALARAAYRPESDVLAIHTGVSGDTIWSVALLWYGDRELASAIARRNNLISSQIRPGQRVVIPKLPEVAA